MKKINMVTSLVVLLEDGIKQVKSVHKEEKEYKLNCSVVKFINSNLKYLSPCRNGFHLSTDNGYGGVYLKEISDNLFDIADTIKISEIGDRLTKGDIIYIAPDTYSRIYESFRSLNLKTLDFVESIFIEKVKSSKDSISKNAISYLFKDKNTGDVFEIYNSSDANIFIENGDFIFN